MEKKLIEDEEEVIRLYTIERFSIVKIAKFLEINQKTISKFLKYKNIKVKYIFTEDHKKNLSGPNENKGSSKGTKATVEQNYKNMASHLRYNVDYLWLMQFEDFEKLKFLNKAVARDRDYKFDTHIYIDYILRFYNDEKFNDVYSKWLFNNKDIWLRPSLDHIKPKLGSDEIDCIDNLEFITWFENRCKSNINIDNWIEMKKNIHFYFT